MQRRHEHLLSYDDDELKEVMKDPYWRIRNLYYILDKDGNEVLFEPNAVQDKFLNEIWYRNVVPKARQRGFSTAVQMMILDACIFNDNIAAGIIAHDDEAAVGIRDNKIKFAWDRLPDFVRASNPLERDNIHELRWANGSYLVVAMSVRSRTLQYLHVSEYGKICRDDPKRAKEIMTGSLPAVDKHGIIVIESTAEGAMGDFYEKCQASLRLIQQGKPLSEMHYKLHFASWWDAREYETAPEHADITSVDHAYFERVEGQIGRPISLPKRAWYVLKRDFDFGGDQESMWSQYPSFLDEAFMVSTEGVFLKDQMSLARRQGRIGSFPWQPAYPVHTWWDLGVDDDIAIWFEQRLGINSYFINFIEGSGEPYSYFWKKMQDLGYVWGKHYLPHDGAHRRPGKEILKTSADMLSDLGMKDIEIVPRVDDLIQGIQELRDDFAVYHFDEVNCKTGIIHLDNYRKTFNMRNQVYTSQPVPNGHQHGADALRQRAQMREHLKSFQSRPNRRTRGGMAA